MNIILNMLMSVSILLVVGLVIWLIYEVIRQVYCDTLRYETFSDTAKVCSKKYEEEYNVYLMYYGEQHCFDDEQLYNSVNIGDSVCILVHKGYNTKNELKNVYLSINL